MRILLFYIGSFLVILGCKKEKQTQKPCRITSVIERYQFRATEKIDTTVLTIQYNEYGNPTVMDFDLNETTKPDYYFTYDVNNRLIQLVTMYGPYIEHLHRYYYEPGSDLIAYDTMYHTVGDGPPYSNWVSNKYKYDDLGRIIEMKVKSNFGASFTLPYGYNSVGNLIMFQGQPNDASGYDSKKSFRATHKTFEFLHRNYSANNVTMATSYNAEGLPLTFKEFLGIDYSTNTTVDFFNMRVSEIKYDCDY